VADLAGLTVAAAKQTVANNPCASTAAVLGTVMTLILYGASVAGVNMPGYIGAIIGTGIVSAGLAFSRAGIVGVWRFVLYGLRGRE
jgi:hypothetical protein